MTAVRITAEALAAAERAVRPHVHRTPLVSSHALSDATGYQVMCKAELLQRTGSYKLRGPLYKLTRLSDAERAAGVICSSAGNHAQGVALAAALNGVRAVVVMAENATPSKVQATMAYGAEVVQHGQIWDEANAHALELAAEHGLTMIHPFDDLDLIAGQATVGMEIAQDLPDADLVVVPIGGGGLISGIASALAQRSPGTRVIGVESSGAPAMKRSVEAGQPVALDHVDCVIDGLRVRRPGDNTVAIVSELVEEVVTLSDEEIFESVVWIMQRCKFVAEAAAAAPVAALRAGLISARPGARVVAVLSGGNLDLSQLHGLHWN